MKCDRFYRMRLSDERLGCGLLCAYKQTHKENQYPASLASVLVMVENTGNATIRQNRYNSSFIGYEVRHLNLSFLCGVHIQFREKI